MLEAKMHKIMESAIYGSRKKILPESCLLSFFFLASFTHQNAKMHAKTPFIEKQNITRKIF